MPPHKSEHYKISVVQYYLSKNKNQVQTCEIFQCHPRSLMRWVNKYNKNKNITRKNRLPKSYKVKKEQVDYILKILNDDKTITMNDMLQKVKEKYSDFDITSRHISNISFFFHCALQKSLFNYFYEIKIERDKIYFFYMNKLFLSKKKWILFTMKTLKIFMNP